MMLMFTVNCDVKDFGGLGHQIFALSLALSKPNHHEDCSSYLRRHSRLCIRLVNLDHEGM
eukprot:scaffold4883_cov120-Skeletonema_dohrnii-CCMP3373.AAC.4